MDNRAKNLIEWSSVVKSSDGYICQRCGFCGEEVIAHHTKAILDEPDLILDIDNGQTLCRTCHIQVHSEQKPSVCCFPREIIYIEGKLTWKPIIPNELKDKYRDYLEMETAGV